MKRYKKFFIELFILISLISLLGVFLNNLIVNLFRTEMGISFKWLLQPTGFAISESIVPYSPSDNYIKVLLIGWLNSLKVILVSLLLATIIGIAAGAARTGGNIFLRYLSSTYVALIRQIPLLLQLFFWYFVGFLNLSETGFEPIGSLLLISNQGIDLLGIHLSSEFSALVVGLTIFTGASIAEVIRGGLNSVQRGQWEAFRSLGIKEKVGLQIIIIPQALPAILPALTSQYLNLAKNSTLAIAVGYADLYAVSDTTITQTGRAIEGFTLLLVIFLSFNLIISISMGMVNKLALVKNSK